MINLNDANKEALKEAGKEALKEAGKQLMALGASLAAGKLEEATKLMETSQAQYAEWAELEKAARDIEAATHNRETARQVEDIVLTLAKAVVSAAVKGVLL